MPAAARIGSVLVFVAGATLLAWAPRWTRAQPESSAAPLIGKPAPPWQVEHWINSPPLQLADLRGRVVLIRFWTAPGCPYCRATAPSLNDFHRRYRDRGLTVLGFYHHKARTLLDARDVARHAHSLGFEFPVAIDPAWTTLRRYWLDHAPHAFTSASFLIDRRGTIRHVHPGGEYVRGDRAFAKIEGLIERLCAE